MKEVYGLFLEDMIANAFIELSNIGGKRINEIPLCIIEKYGEEVINKLDEEGKKGIFCLSRENYERFGTRYKDYFTIKEDTEGSNHYLSVILSDKIQIDDLIRGFRTYLRYDLLLAYMNKDVVKKGLLVPLNLLVQEKVLQKKKDDKIKKYY